jgi:hypothetical protein
VKKVLFVCTANTCRSPMAAALFNAPAEDRSLPFRAESAGTAALEGTPMAENTLAALEEVGNYPGPPPRPAGERGDGRGSRAGARHEHPQHAATLRRLGGDPPRGIHALPEYATGVAGEGIADPYGLTMAAHRRPASSSSARSASVASAA